jgi:hypothetical protein
MNVVYVCDVSSCVYVSSCVCVYIRMYIRMYIRVYIRVFAHLCEYVCYIYVWIYVCQQCVLSPTDVLMCAYIYIYMYMCVCVCFSRFKPDVPT